MNLDGLKRWGQQRPLRREVAAAMRNPAEYDPFSTNMSPPLEEATSGLAASLKAMPDEIYFFGSGRLAHQIVLAGALKGQANREVWARFRYSDPTARADPAYLHRSCRVTHFQM